MAKKPQHIYFLLSAFQKLHFLRVGCFGLSKGIESVLFLFHTSILTFTKVQNVNTFHTCVYCYPGGEDEEEQPGLCDISWAQLGSLSLRGSLVAEPPAASRAKRFGPLYRFPIKSNTITFKWWGGRFSLSLYSQERFFLKQRWSVGASRHRLRVK